MNVFALMLLAMQPFAEQTTELLDPPVPLDKARQEWIRCTYRLVDQYERQKESAETTVRATMKSCEREYGFYHIALHDHFLRSGMSQAKADAFLASSVRKTEDDLLSLIFSLRAKR